MKKNIFYSCFLFILGIFSSMSSAQAQENEDLQTLQKATSAHTTPRGVAVVAQMHIAHPETTHPSKYRGYYIYRKELGNYKSEQDAKGAFKKIMGRELSADIEKDAKELFDRVPYKRLNKVPIAQRQKRGRRRLQQRAVKVQQYRLNAYYLPNKRCRAYGHCR